MLRMKELISYKTRFPGFDKILAIAEAYAESNERQVCSEIVIVL